MNILRLDQLPLDKATRNTLGISPDIDGAVVVGTERVVVYGPGCDYRTLHDAWTCTPGAHSVWSRGSNAPNSRVDHAILMMSAGFSANAAAKKVGVNSSAVYRALALRNGRGTCHTCGALMHRLPAAA